MKKLLSYFLILLFIHVSFYSCKESNPKLLESGVSKQLAELREQQLNQIKYQITFQIPDSLSEQVEGSEIIEFNFKKIENRPLVLDFRNPESFIKSVILNSKKVKYKFKNEHIIIPAKKLINGQNKIKIHFTAGNRALNRNQEYLYTLFVPDRACTAFPCFDQPSLKARFKTELHVPKQWIAVANSPQIVQTEEQNKRKRYVFEETDLISTYLYSFVAGKFDSISKKYEDREIVMYHREDDSIKLKKNTDKLFDLHYSSLKWLEQYTNIDYPFNKFDFVLIPSFQYSGMEHPGAILYRDSRLLLEDNASITEELNRANLIAHETSHMWFGDLVTMEWFSEVWLKEVFANFMAGKIVNPQYPEVNHELNFLINHYPPSYEVDRTKGANPIEQQLDNMKNAGTLYGSIIYHKAPIVMNKLETITGQKKLQEGIRQYLRSHMYSNATWDDLIQVLDQKTELDLTSWSHSWVYEPGMPFYKVHKAYNVNDKLESVIIEQSDPLKKGREWSQEIMMLVNGKEYAVELKDTYNAISLNNQIVEQDYIFPNSTGLGYGYFQLDSVSKASMLSNLSNFDDPVLRCSMYISLWENMLNGDIESDALFNAFLSAVDKESNPQNINLLLNYISTIFWKFTLTQERSQYSDRLEDFLWQKMLNVKSAGVKSNYFKTFRTIVVSDEGIKKLYNLWSKELTEPKLELTEQDFTHIAFELAIRNHKKSDSVLNVQSARISNIERKKRFEFIRPTVSNDTIIRDQFFNSLNDEKNREKEPWVIDALYYLHHPLRNSESVKYIVPSLYLLEDIQRTGDIFFPKRWLDATFSGHNSIDAVLDINLFLNENPDFPENLRNKIHQSSDLVFRASILNEK